jgi:hypothetical protein
MHESDARVLSSEVDASPRPTLSLFLSGQSASAVAPLSGSGDDNATTENARSVFRFQGISKRASLPQWSIDIIIGAVAAVIMLLVIWASVQPKTFVYQGY